MYFNVCSICGSNLDPGEKCDCMQNSEQVKKLRDNMTDNDTNDNKDGKASFFLGVYTNGKNEGTKR